MLQPKKPVVKKPTKNKPKLGGEIGRPPFTNEERKKMPKVGSMGSAKNGKSFPDLNKDGKITKADILKGRGVIAKKGMSVKKAQDGYKASKTANDWNNDRLKKYPSVKMTSTKNYDVKETTYPGGDKETTTKFNPRGGAKFNIPAISKKKDKNEISGTKGMSENEKVKRGITKLAPLKKKMQYGGKAASMVPMKKAMMGNTMMKSGGKMKTCKGGC
jgi:hypothetical protein